MASAPIQVKFAVVALIRRGYRYLMVRDDGRGGAWYPPAGSLEPGEDLLGGACRIVQMASGCTPDIEGIVSITHMPQLPGRDAGRLRFILDGRVSVESLVEQTAMVPSTWMLPAEVRGIELRNSEMAKIIHEHARGGSSVPIGLYRVGL